MEQSMKFTISINEPHKKVNVHALDCSFLNDNKQEDISLYCKSYEEAWSWVSLGNFEDAYDIKDCECCNPGDWSEF